MKKRTDLIPSYTYIPFILCAVAIVVSFYGTRAFTADGYHYDVSTALDSKIPFVPAFIVIYVLAYAQWVLTLLLAAREGMGFYFKAASVEVVGKLLAIPIFLIFPTAMVRPEIQGEGFFSWLTGLIYAFDSPDNLFPSLHCLDSWLCLRVMFQMKKMPGWVKWANALFSLLVFASVVLVKQHLAVDILGGIALGEIAFLVCKLTKAEGLMYRIVPRRWQEKE